MRSLSKLVVNLNSVGYNVELVHALQRGQKKILPMVKAQSYGHGLLPVSKFMIDQVLSGKWNFLEGLGVATVEEAFFLRSQLSRCPIPIYVFSEVCLKEKKEWYEQWGFIPVISQICDLETFTSEKSFKELPLVMKFNSGMNRLGINIQEQDKVIEILKKNNRNHIYHLMSHFALSYVSNHPSIKAQMQVMDTVKENFFSANISLEHFSMSNSGAIEQATLVKDETVLRPGIILYGPSSMEEKQSIWQKGKIVSSLETRILDVRQLRAGECFGYGLTKTNEDGYLLILPLGYADGIQFGFNGFSFLIDQVKVKFFARPNMDICYLWTTDSKVLSWKEKKIQLWSPMDDNLQSLSVHNQTIAYHLLTSISSRVPREYVLE